MALRVLVACRHRSVLEDLEPLLAGFGYEVFCALAAGEALALASARVPDVVLWGLEPEDDAPGPATLARRLPAACRIVMGDDGADGLASEVTERGFWDALPLPCTDGELRLVMHRATAWCRQRVKVEQLQRELSSAAGSRPIVAASPPMIELLEAIERSAGFRAPVLLRGEAGTGKEGLARAIHALSDRRGGPFVSLRCRGPEAEVTAALFGRHADEEPAQVGALVAANGGTLFLDEVEHLSAECQERLLVCLQSEEVTAEPDDKPRQVDVRVLAASARDLRASVSLDEFRGELLERLASVELAVPPLRERPEDIPLLVDHFCGRASDTLGCERPTLADEALARLVGYRWPGNVRELENVTCRAVMLARGGRITPQELPERLEAGDDAGERDLGLRRARKRLEVEVIRRALRQTGGNRTHAARLLEISHRALLYKLKEYGITS